MIQLGFAAISFCRRYSTKMLLQNIPLMNGYHILDLHFDSIDSLMEYLGHLENLNCQPSQIAQSPVPHQYNPPTCPRRLQRTQDQHDHPMRNQCDVQSHEQVADAAPSHPFLCHLSNYH